MPPMPPMPPPMPPPAGAFSFFSGFSEMMHSVVRMSPAMLDAFSSAVRDHLGRVDDAGLQQVFVLVRDRRCTRNRPCSSSPRCRPPTASMPALATIMRSGSSMARRMMSTPSLFVAFELQAVKRDRRADQRNAAARQRCPLRPPRASHGARLRRAPSSPSFRSRWPRRY